MWSFEYRSTAILQENGERMPTSPPKRCTRCKQLFTGRRCSCRVWSSKPSSWTRNRTNDPAWRGVRELVLDESPLCVGCGAIASQVDHKDGTDYSDDSGEGHSWLNPAMCRPLCEKCHWKRTSRQGNAAKRP